MTLPRLTIITPSLNQGRYLERALRSVLDQGYDRSRVHRYGRWIDRRIGLDSPALLRPTRVLGERTRPGSIVRNQPGIVRATGDVVAYINSDDYYLPGAFAAALPLFDDPDVAWVAGGCRYEESDGTLETHWRPELPRAPSALDTETPGTYLRRRRSGGGEYSRSTDSCGRTCTTFSTPSSASALRSAACCRESATLTLPCVFFTARLRAPTPHGSGTSTRRCQVNCSRFHSASGQRTPS